MRARGRAGWAALCAVISVTCGRSPNQGTGGPQGTAASGVDVSIDPAAVAIMGGGTVRFAAAVKGTADTAVIWSTDAGKIDQGGFYTAPATPGTFSVTARSHADPGRSASASVSVSTISVTLSPQTTTVAPGGMQQFTALVTGSADPRVSWTVTEGPQGGSIDGAGTYTAPAGTGTFHLVAASIADPGQTATAVVNVARPAGVWVSVTPRTADLPPGGTALLAATVTGTLDTRVIWTSDGGRIRQDGFYTAPSTEGTWYVTAQSFSDPTRVGVATLHVAGPSQASPVEPETVTVETGGLVVFRAHLPGTTDAEVSWSIHEGDAGGKIDALGQYVAPSDHEGIYHVVATSRADPSKTGIATVTVQRLDLIDHGGTVAATTRTFALWWGDEKAFPPDARPLLESLLQGLDGSAWLRVTDEYMRGAHATTSFAGSLFDSSAPPAQDPAESEISDQACRSLDRSGMTLAAGDVVFVVSSVFPAGNGPFCAWHYWGLCHGQSLLVVYLPNPKGTACLRAAAGCNASSAEATALGIFAAHEFIETITDPFITAWRDPLGQEIGDKCFGTAACFQLSTGILQLQPLYSNSAHACVQP
jgi:hypothetical protein